jgi:asparagine synthase (glutamine-hydrolysing)
MKNNTKILFESNLGWKKIAYKKKIIFYKGYLYNNNFLNILKKIFLCKNKKKYISKLDGLFAFIAKDKNHLIVCVDKISSIPIFFQKDKKENIVSNKTSLIQKKNQNKLSKSSIVSLFMSGYTIGNATIFEKIEAVEAGTFFEINNKKYFEKTKYYKFEPWNFEKKQNIKKIEEDYHKCNLDVFKKIKNYCDIRNVGLAISLTAGYDSRLTLAMLNKLKFKNLICFTYGIKNNYENIAAKKICKFLKIKHVFVEITNSKIKKTFKKKIFKKFVENSEQGLSTLDTAEFVVIEELKKKKFLNNKIIVNGLSGDFISGGHQLEKFLNPSKRGLDQTCDAIIKKHFKLWIGNNYLIDDKIINSLLRKYFQSLKIKIKNKNNYGLIEHFDLHNRQSKYSLSRQQIYNYFNLEWLLPHFDTEYLNFWQKIKPQLKTNQKFYDYFLRKKDYEKIWSSKEWSTLRLKRPRPLSINTVILIPIFKIFFFYDKKKYHKYYTKYLDYFNETIAGYGEFNYFKEVITEKDIFRNFISLKVKKYVNYLTNNYKF